MDTIRITSGFLKGRRIKSPKSALTHPMGSREKLALFNMITDYLPQATVLDAFAGSGALGIEALSRGAKSVVFIEKNPRVAQIIKDNLLNLELPEKVFVGDVKEYITNQLFDLILVDPPYDNFEEEKVFYLTKYLNDGGVFVLSHPGSPPEIENLNLTKTRKYAQANISIYRK